MRAWGPVVVGVLLFRPPAALAVEYSGQHFRDPFESLTPAKSQAVAVKEALPRLEGVLWNVQPPRAILSGQVVGVGNRVGSAEVIRIEKEGVTIRMKGREYVLSRKGGAK